MSSHQSPQSPPNATPSNPGWTPRLDGSLMIEHEIIVAQLQQLHHQSHQLQQRTWLRQVKDSVVARMILGVRNTILQHMRQKARLGTPNILGRCSGHSYNVTTDVHGWTGWVEVTETLTSLWGTPIDFRIWVRHRLRFARRNCHATPCHFARPLKQRLSKSDLAKIGDGKPDRVKAHVSASLFCIVLHQKGFQQCVRIFVCVHFFNRKCLRCLLCFDRLFRQPGHQLKKT